MDNTFMEKIVRKQRDSKDYLMIAGSVIAYIILMLVTLQFLPQVLILVLFAGGWGLWWLITSTNKEYEYSVTDNFIDIDCIIAQRKRQRVFSGDAKEFEMCARMNTDLVREYSKGNVKLLNFAPTNDNSKNYFIVTRNNAKKAKTKGQAVMVIFEPDDRMVPSLKKFNPSKIKVEGLY